MGLITKLIICLSLIILTIEGQNGACNKEEVVRQWYREVVAPYVQEMKTSSIYPNLVTKAQSLLTSSELSTFNSVLGCVTNGEFGTSCPSTVTTEVGRLMYLVNQIQANSGLVNTVLKVISSILTFNTNTYDNLKLKTALTNMETIGESACNIPLNFYGDTMISVQTTTNILDKLKIEIQFNEINVLYSEVLNIENTLGVVTTIAVGTDLQLGVFALSKIVAFLSLTPFFEEILQVLETPQFVDVLTDLGAAIRSGQDLIAALQTLLDVLLCEDFFVALSDLLTIQDLGNLIASLLAVVVALLQDVLLLVAALLLLLASLATELAVSLPSILCGLLGLGC